MRFTACLLLLLLLLAGPARAQDAGSSPAEGLLLGLQTIEPAPEPLPYYAAAPDSMAAPIYRTLLLAPSDTGAALVDSLRGLVIPRSDTLWRVGVKRSVYNDWVEDFLWATPLGTPPEYAGISTFNGEYCSGHRTQRLLYAGPRYLSFEQRSAGACEGSAHPWYYKTLGVIPIDSTAHLGLSIEEVLGPAARDTLEATVARFRDTLNTSSQEAFASHPDPANWALVRRHGRWVVEGRLDPASEAVQSVSADLPLNVSPHFIGDVAPAQWEALAAAHDSLRDAFRSPDGTWLVLLHEGRLTAHTYDAGGELSAPQLNLPLPPRTEAVTIRWLPKQRLKRIAAQIETPRRQR